MAAISNYLISSGMRRSSESGDRSESIPVALDVIDSLGEWKEVTRGIRQLNYEGKELAAKLRCPELGTYPQEMQITELDPDLCQFVVEGDPHSGAKDFVDALSPEGSVAINGGFFNSCDWYQVGGILASHIPIGLLKSSAYDNTDRLPLDKEETTHHNKSFHPFTSDTSNGTLTPSLYRDCYGVLCFENGGVTLLSQQEVDDHPDLLETVDYCQAAGPILVSEGEVTFLESQLLEERFQWEVIYKQFGDEPGACPPGSFYHADQRNPRSVIGINPEQNRVYFVTVRGRYENYIEGFTLPQTALLMQRLGIQNAINLDGGFCSFQLTRKGEKEWKWYDSSPFTNYAALSAPLYIVASPKEQPDPTHG